ncbi:MAG: SPOR domain-containing protein [Gallionella sp.]|nr:SPOR domain-containing protein [Gallionella sp.]MDD4957869.1 SPOR domain-containing protein [Gallionella sp.]
MTKELSVDEQALKRKTRHRLLGAGALTLFIVVALPMFLDNEPKQAGTNISLDIPSPEKISEFTSPTPSAETIAPTPETPATSPAIIDSNAGDTPVAPRRNDTAPAKNKLSSTNAESTHPVMVIPPVRSRTERTDNKRYLLHVGNYSNPAKAAQVAEKLKQNNLNVTIEKSNNKTRIHVGPFTDREQADKARQLLQKQGTRSTLVISK